MRSPTRDEDAMGVERGQPAPLADAPSGATDRYAQRITLRPTGTRPLFAMAGAIQITPRRDLKLRFHSGTGVLQTEDPLTHPVEYEVVSTNVLPPEPARSVFQEERRKARPRWSRINPRVLQYTVDPDVSGRAAGGASLAEARPREVYAHELDERIAKNIETHLRTAFTYTLDLTDAAKLRRNDDPMVAFLYDLKRGHCEYFAGAMALMCQSLGMQARVVNGFKCDEYNATPGPAITSSARATPTRGSRC
jgi:transglutaminase-like putative cysteine protease